jgi:hypothetical protein
MIAGVATLREFDRIGLSAYKDGEKGAGGLRFDSMGARFQGHGARD